MEGKHLIDIVGTTTLTVLIPCVLLAGCSLFDKYISGRYRGTENNKPAIENVSKITNFYTYQR